MSTTYLSRVLVCWCDEKATVYNEPTDATPAHPACDAHVKDGFHRIGEVTYGTCTKCGSTCTALLGPIGGGVCKDGCTSLTEHQVVVVIDVVGHDRESAHRMVNASLSGLVGEQIGSNTVVSWWFPESDVKHVDGNDNTAMHLVPDPLNT